LPVAKGGEIANLVVWFGILAAQPGTLYLARPNFHPPKAMWSTQPQRDDLLGCGAAAYFHSEKQRLPRITNHGVP
jgi:hypothetical protein